MGEIKKAVQFARTGNPPDVVEVVEMETAPVGPGDVLIDVEAASINPSHLLTLSGNYGVQPDLPAVPGAEGIGKIVEVGGDIDWLPMRAAGVSLVIRDVTMSGE